MLHGDGAEPDVVLPDLMLPGDLRRVRRMVDDLLEISRYDQDRSTFELVDLTELVLAVTRHHGAVAPDAVDVAARPWIVGNRRRLERVVVNLLDNATRHGNGLVRPGITRAGGRARVEVDDAGPGVPAADREHVFERFSRGSPADREATDSGLGLALVAQHVHDHDGRTWAEDRPGGGARFVVELPEAPPPATG
ncbi:sensor histidine kinase [Actinophytocola oryzae]|uniref:histidine kinase n=1 Tax=Actinophytocola oryzae TaxID=502181 RepID=A0A4R7W547_9PSEU|nr:HAMP domain-containing sensor histidine kinase [Actinophytocola oryzae]TDV57345.1 histidine kinase/DNA gyrase B/HSP90-like ATPase [Actinophytocola oryzae]